MHKIDPLAGQVSEGRKFTAAANHCVSKRPIWLGEAAQRAQPPGDGGGYELFLSQIGKGKEAQ